jgi:hypothetical protein
MLAFLGTLLASLNLIHGPIGWVVGVPFGAVVAYTAMRWYRSRL